MHKELPAGLLFLLTILLAPAAPLLEFEASQAFLLGFLILLPLVLYIFGLIDLDYSRSTRSWKLAVLYVLATPVFALAAARTLPEAARRAVSRADDCAQVRLREAERIERDRKQDPHDAWQMQACEEAAYRYGLSDGPPRPQMDLDDLEWRILRTGSLESF